MKRSLFALGVCLSLASPAVAQIYTWRDAAGTLVLSDRPREGDRQIATHVVPGSQGVRATKPTTLKTSRFDDAIRRHAGKNGVSADLVRAVIQVESAYNPSAVSPKGAMGLMQLMPATAAEFGVRDPFEPEQNIGAGVAYLKRLLDRYDQRVELALAAYNAGPGNVEKYGDVPPFRETRNYIKKVTESAPSAPPNAIYRWMDIVDGRPVNRYSNRPPPSGAYTVVGLRR